MKQLLISILCLNGLFANAQKIATPKPKVTMVEVGSPLRKELLNLSRPQVEKEVGQAVEFLEPKIRVVSDYAFVFSLIQQKGGKALDLKKLNGHSAEAFDNNYQAIYVRKKGKWGIYKQYTGCTDVCWAEWIEDKSLPKGLLPSDDNR